MPNYATSGTVKWFDDAKGYGFIAIAGQPDDREHSVFVGFAQIERDGDKFRTLLPQQRVIFDIGIDRSGRRHAVNVRAIDP